MTTVPGGPERTLKAPSQRWARAVAGVRTITAINVANASLRIFLPDLRGKAAAPLGPAILPLSGSN